MSFKLEIKDDNRIVQATFYDGVIREIRSCDFPEEYDWSETTSRQEIYRGIESYVAIRRVTDSFSSFDERYPYPDNCLK